MDLVRCLCGLVALFASRGADVEVARIVFHETAGIARRDQIVSAGILLPRGSARDGGVWTVKAGSRRTRARATPLLRWPDTSLRAVRLVFPVTVSAGGRRRVKVYHQTGQDDVVLEPLAWFEEGRVRLRCARLEAVIPAETETALLRLGDRRRGVTVLDRASTGEGGGPGRVEIVEEGPLRAVVRQVGEVVAAAGDAVIGVERLIVAPAGGAYVDLETRVTCSSHRGAGVAVDVRLETPAAIRSIGGLRTQSLPWILEVDRLGRTARPDDLAGRFSVSTGRRRFGLAVEAVQRLAPWRLRLDTDRQLAVGIVSDAYHWWRGVRPARLVRIGVGERVPPPPRSLVVERPLAATQPAAPRHPAGDRIQAVIRRELDREPGFLDWIGEENAGDWRWSRSDAGNLEYDTLWGVRVAALSSRSPALLAATARSMRHLLRRDLDLGGSGVPLRHGPHHRLGGVELGHVWLEGLLASAVDEADHFVWADAMEVVERWRGMIDATDPAEMLARSLGWGLLSAVAVARLTGTPADVDRLDVLRDALADAPGAAVPLLERLRDEEHLWRVSTWVSAGIIGEAVWQADVVSPHAAARQRLLGCCRMLAREGWDRREGRLFKTLIVDDRDGGVVHRSGVASGEEMLFFALGLLRAHSLGGDGELESTARAILRIAPERLRLESKTFRGMEISQLLWLHPRLFGWRR